MTLNPSIILAGQSPDIVGNINRGVQTGRNIFAGQRDNALASLFQEYGPGIAGGDQNALSALARFDPTMSLGVQESRLGMDQTRLQMRAMEEQMQQRRAQAAQVAQQLAAQGRAQEAAAMLQEQQRLFAQASSIQSPEQWDAFMQANEAPEYVGQFGNREGIIRGLLVEAEGFGEALGFSLGGEGIAPTDDIREYQFAVENGFIGSFEEWMTRNRNDGFEVFDPITGNPIFRQGVPGAAAEPTGQPAQAAQIAPVTGADTAFGLGGIARGVANTVADTIGANVPFPETLQAQSDINTAGEAILSQVAAGYSRQPPSWLLQEIRNLIPFAGRVQGSQSASARYSSLRRQLETDIANAQAAMRGARNNPTRLAELEDRIRGGANALQLIDQIANGIQGGGATDDDAAVIQRYLD